MTWRVKFGGCILDTSLWEWGDRRGERSKVTSCDCQAHTVGQLSVISAAAIERRHTKSTKHRVENVKSKARVVEGAAVSLPAIETARH